jgi:hypothetical protein
MAEKTYPIRGRARRYLQAEEIFNPTSELKCINALEVSEGGFFFQFFFSFLSFLVFEAVKIQEIEGIRNRTHKQDCRRPIGNL